MKTAGNPTHYDTLRVAPGASSRRVRLAYRQLAQKHHPDKFQGQGDAADLMVQINQAYEVLSDPQRRAAYDLALAAGDLRRRRAAAAAAVLLQDRFGWASWLLLVVLLLTVLTVGYVVLKATVPARPPLRVPETVAQPAAAEDATPLLPVQPIQPWVEPPRSVVLPNDATDPVKRLVREGTMANPPSRRSAGEPAR